MSGSMYGGSFNGGVEHVQKRYGGGSRSQVDYKARTVQGDVTVNLGVDDSEAKRRYEWSDRFTADERVGDFKHFEHINIKRGDLVFLANRSDGGGADGARAFAAATARQDNAVVSFNGYPKMGAATRDAFQANFRFAGVAKGTYVHGQSTQPKNGVAVQHKGATTVPNTGPHEFAPGDRIRARVPHMNAAQRKQAERDAAPYTSKTGPPGRLAAVPEAVDYANDVLGLPRLAVSTVLMPGRKAGQFSARMLRPHASRSVLSQVERFGIAHKHAMLQTAWNAVAVLDAYGLITLNMPTGATSTAYNSLATTVLNKTLPKTLAAQRPVLAATQAGGGMAVTRTEPRGGAAATAKRQQLMWLAQQLDLVHDSADYERSVFKPSRHLSEAVFATCASPLFGDAKIAARYSARRFLDPTSEPAADTNVRVRTSDQYHFTAQTYDAQLAKSQHDAQIRYYQTAVGAKLFVDQTIVGEALNRSRPGMPLDINM